MSRGSKGSQGYVAKAMSRGSQGYEQIEAAKAMSRGSQGYEKR